MKRLIRKAFGLTLYHGTSLESLKKITEDGMMIPQEGDHGVGLAMDSNLRASQTAVERISRDGLDPDNMEIFQKYYQEELEKENQKLQGYTFFTNNMRTALMYAWNSSGYKVVIEVSLSEDALMPDDNDCPTCETWQESLELTQQVKVIGNITSDYIVGVHFYDSNDKKVAFYPKLTWVDNM